MTDSRDVANATELEARLEQLILSGAVAAGQRMPSIRQLAHDTGLAPGTVAKAYARLTERGVLVTGGRAGGRAGTRVAAGVDAPPPEVVEAARGLVQALRRHELTLSDGQRLLSALWPRDQE